jgi:cation transport ATPase
MPPDAQSAVRQRSVLSAIFGVLLLLAAPVGAFPFYAAYEMVARGHRLRDRDAWVLVGSALATVWLIWSGVAYLRKAPGAGVLRGAGLLAFVFVGLALATRGFYQFGRFSEPEEVQFFAALLMLPLFIGVGQLREARRRSGTVAYVLAPILCGLGVAFALHR